jgi:AcrR family transcriptional regulator
VNIILLRIAKSYQSEEYPMKNQIDFKGLDRSVRLQKIIDTAAGLFHEKGFKSATLNGLARELGLSKTALYHYVSSKEQLLSMVYSQAFERIFERIHEISTMDVALDENLRLILREHIKNITIKNAALYSVFFAEENQLPQDDFEKIRAEKRKYSLIIEDIIKEGISKRIFKSADPRLHANAILGMCNWVYKWYRLDRSTYTPDQVADHFITLLEAGYLAGRPLDAGGKHLLVSAMEPSIPLFASPHVAHHLLSGSRNAGVTQLGFLGRRTCHRRAGPDSSLFPAAPADACGLPRLCAQPGSGAFGLACRIGQQPCPR